MKTRIENKIITLKLNSEIVEMMTSSDENVNLILHNIKPKTITIEGKIIPFKLNKIIVEARVSWAKSRSKEKNIILI